MTFKTKSEAEKAFTAIVKKHGLTTGGFGEHPYKPKDFYYPCDVDAFWFCIDWLEKAKLTRRCGTTSEHLRVVAEVLWGPEWYVATGVLIAAIIHLGIPYEQQGNEALTAVCRDWVSSQIKEWKQAG